MSEKYDLVVIGGGPGGLAAAETAGAGKKKVLIIERDGWGGTCTHRGCIPTKTLLAGSKLYDDLKKLKRIGVDVADVSADFAAMKKHRQSVVKLAALGAQKLLADAGVEIKLGVGEIISSKEVRYADFSGKTFAVETDGIVLAWGSQPQLLPGVQTSERVLTSDGILRMMNIPSSIIIIGGSFIGVEYATFFAEMGSKVILVELLERILPQEDRDASELLQQELSRKGVALHTSTKITGLKDDGGSEVVIFAKKSGETVQLSAENVLLCAGRKPLLDRNQLDRVGIDYTDAGIKVDGTMMTSAPGVYAVGDVTGGLMLAHRAALQAKVAVNHFLGRDDFAYNEDFIPSVVYSHPQVARIGYTQKRAQDEGLSVEIRQSLYSANILARAQLLGQGFAKAIFLNDKIIGATIVGEGAAELIVPLGLAVSAELTRERLRAWVIPHPTLSEIFLPLLDK